MCIPCHKEIIDEGAAAVAEGKNPVPAMARKTAELASDERMAPYLQELIKLDQWFIDAQAQLSSDYVRRLDAIMGGRAQRSGR